MPARIDKLTPAQEAQMPAHRDKWIERGLSCAPADHAKVEWGIRESYRFAKLDPPKRIVWVKSPAILAVAAPTAAFMIALGRKPDVAVGGAVGDAVRGAVDDAVRGAVGVAVRVAVGVAVGVAVDDAKRNSNGDAVKNGVLQAIRSGWSYILGGRWWSGWYWYGLASTTFFRDVTGLQLKGDLWDRNRAYEAMMDAGWIWPHRDFVMIAEPPTELNREEPRPNNAVRRLHKEDGPAIKWGDGTCIYFLHGVRVDNPDFIVTPDALTAQRIREEKNAEVRRVMVDRYGAQRFVRDMNPDLVHQDDWGKLYRADFPGEVEPYLYVEYLNSSPEDDGSYKTYFSRVHPELRQMRSGKVFGEPQKLTAHNAIASLYGKRGEEYHPCQQT